MEDHQSGTRPEAVVGQRNAGVLLIGVFKLIEAVFFFLVGIGAIHFLHRDMGDAAVHLATKLRIDPDGRLFGWVLDHLDAITAHRLKEVGAFTFVFAGIRVTEGVGLMLEKRWAEYMTVGVTISFLPWEIFEIVRQFDWFRVGLFVVNLGVLAYLVWWLRRSRVRREHGARTRN